MLLRRLAILLPFGAAVADQGVQTAYGQCGGTGYSGPTACEQGYTCSSYNEYYAQCYPGGSPATSSRTTLLTSATKPATSASTGAASSPTKTAAGGAAGPVPTTLVSGWYWVRAVADPNFHKYLQSKPTLTAGDAFIDSNKNAGQFNIVDGQLVYYTGPDSDPLYMNVEDPADKTQRKLRTWFDSAKNTFGTFSFSGDTVQWSTPEINRPNLAAWLVCEDQHLFINTGAYLYQTPAGCADQTIHSYGGSEANV